jgi:hypothetical protein
LGWHNYPTYLDLGGLVRHAGTANHFVAASSSMAKWVAGVKRKGGEGRSQNPKSEFRQPLPGVVPEIRNKHE